MQSGQAAGGLLDFTALAVPEADWEDLDALEFERYRRFIRDNSGPSVAVRVEAVTVGGKEVLVLEIPQQLAGGNRRWQVSPAGHGRRRQGCDRGLPHHRATSLPGTQGLGNQGLALQR